MPLKHARLPIPPRAHLSLSSLQQAIESTRTVTSVKVVPRNELSELLNSHIQAAPRFLWHYSHGARAIDIVVPDKFTDLYD